MPYTILERGSLWVLAVDEVTQPSRIPYHHCGPVAVAVKGELCVTGPLVVNCPKHDIPILFIGNVHGVNEEKPSLLLMKFLLSQQFHSVYGTLNFHLRPSTELICPTGFLSLRDGPPRHTLSSAASRFPHAHRADARVLAQPDQPARHQGAICRPRWSVVSHPLGK